MKRSRYSASRGAQCRPHLHVRCATGATHFACQAHRRCGIRWPPKCRCTPSQPETLYSYIPTPSFTCEPARTPSAHAPSSVLPARKLRSFLPQSCRVRHRCKALRLKRQPCPDRVFVIEVTGSIALPSLARSLHIARLATSHTATLQASLHTSPRRPSPSRLPLALPRPTARGARARRRERPRAQECVLKTAMSSLWQVSAESMASLAAPSAVWRPCMLYCAQPLTASLHSAIVCARARRHSQRRHSHRTSVAKRPSEHLPLPCAQPRVRAPREAGPYGDPGARHRRAQGRHGRAGR